MTSEERILAYLDGNLSEKESAELLHQLSVSPENRVVLEQHLKLNELTRLGQKPFAVPEEVEASLSKRLPIILSGSEAGTSSMQTITRSGSLLMLLRRYPVRFAIGGLLLLFSAGAGYRFLSPNENNDTQSVTSSTGSSSVPSSAQNPVASTPTASSATENTTAANNTSSTTASSNNVSNERLALTTANNSAGTNSSAAIADDLHPQGSVHSSSTTRNHEHSSIDRQISKNTTGHSTGISSHDVKNSSSNNGGVVHNDARDIANNSSSSKITLPPTQPTAVASAEEHLTVVPQVSVLADNSGSAMPIQPISDAKNRRSLNTFETLRNPERSDFSVRTAGSIMGAFINVPSGNNSFTARSEFGFSAGVNYHASTEITIGIELGRSSIMVVSPQTTIETSLSDQLNHVVAHTYTTTVSAMYTLGALRYTVFPYNATHLEFSAEGGTMLTPTLSAMVGFQALICNTLTDALEFQGGLAATGVWSTNTATAIQTPNVTGPTIYKTESVPANKIFSPTVIAKAGIQYRF